MLQPKQIISIMAHVMATAVRLIAPTAAGVTAFALPLGIVALTTPITAV